MRVSHSFTMGHNLWKIIAISSRSHEVELAYAEEKKKIGQEWDSMSSCCKHVFLHCPFKRRLIEGEKNESEKLKTVDDDDIRKLQGLGVALKHSLPTLTLTENAAPYSRLQHGEIKSIEMIKIPYLDMTARSAKISYCVVLCLAN